MRRLATDERLWRGTARDRRVLVIVWVAVVVVVQIRRHVGLGWQLLGLIGVRQGLSGRWRRTAGVRSDRRGRERQRTVAQGSVAKPGGSRPLG